MMVTKSWCDSCMKAREGVHLYDSQCLDCGKMETATGCPECRYNGRLIETLKCSRCNRGTMRKLSKSLFPEHEITARRS